MARRKRGRRDPISKHSKEYKDHQKKRAASRRTSDGRVKKGAEKDSMKRARAAQKLKKDIQEGKTQIPVDKNYEAKLAKRGSYGSKKIAPKAQGRKASVSLTAVPERYKDERGRVSYSPQSIRAAFKDIPAESRLGAMTKEYSRLRAAAVKRMGRLEGAGFGKSQISKYYSSKLPKIQGMSRADIEKNIAEMLTDVNRFLGSDLSTVKGQTELRNQRILTLKEYGYDVDWSNFEYLTDVLDYIRDTYQDLFFDSDQIIQDAIDKINEVMNDPEFMSRVMNEEKPGQVIGEEVYERYSSNSAELRGLSGL